MIYNIRMFSRKKNITTCDSEGYQSINSHSHTFIEMVYVEEGMGIHYIVGKRIKIKKGDLFFINPGIEHSIKPFIEEGEFRIRNVLIEPEYCTRNDFFDPTEIFNSFSDEVGTLIHKLGAVCSSFKTTDEDALLLINAIIDICEFEKREKMSNITNYHLNKKDDYLQKATYYIRKNYNKKITIKEIADYVGIYPSYLEKIFKEGMDTTIQNHLMLFRISKSCQYLLETDLPLEEICSLVGINDLKNYYTYFKKVFNTTPIKFKTDKKNSDRMMIQ